MAGTGGFQTSIDALKAQIEDDASAALYTDLGALYMQYNDLAAAEQTFLNAVELDPEYVPLYGYMMTLYAAKGDCAKALEWAALAVQATPENAEIKRTLTDILSGMKIRIFHPNIYWLVYECVRDINVDVDALWPCWLVLLRKSPAWGALYRRCKLKNYEDFEKSFGKIDSYAALVDPFFLRGLERFTAADYEFELFLTYLRRYLCAQVNDPLTGLDDMQHMNLLLALSSYCYRTEYIFYSVAEENLWLENIRQKLETSPHEASLPEVLLFSCYIPLHGLANAEGVDTCFGGAAEFDDYLQCQILDHKEQQAARKKIQTLTDIDDAVSGTVQAQYESFPYPRWDTLAQDASPDSYVELLGADLMAPLLAEGAKILIAGCGTGQQALEYGIAFPDADVTAIDLSLTSLSYAQWRKQDFKIPNVTFYQGDILKLGDALTPDYDLIVSTGVLHHMADPEAGWRVLSGLLKPRGLMRIALYSELARQFIVRGRDVIAARGFGDTDSEIKRFRYEGHQYLKKADLQRMKNAEDFYSLSECRDMLFHVQEQRFDISRLQAALEICGLDFLKFEQIGALQDRYLRMFPDDPQLMNLDHWQVFEQKNPMSFINMYRFWCHPAESGE